MKTRPDRGQSLVETSMILAAFMALIFGMIYVGQTMFVRETFTSRVHAAARWGAVNTYDPQVIRNLVLYGTPTPDPGAMPFMRLGASEIVIANPGCPGAQCRVSVAIPKQGIHSAEPVESGNNSTAALSKP